MAGHLRRIDQGDRSLVALPVFPLRNFTARDLYVRKDGPVRTPADLRGRRVGMYDWVASGSIWYRHFLRFIDVTPEDLAVVHRRGRRAEHHQPRLYAAGWRARRTARTRAVGDADRRRAGRDVQPAAAAALSSGGRADRAAVPRHPRDRARVFPRHAHVPAAASDRAAARGLAAEQMDRALADRCVRPLHRDVRQGAAFVPLRVAVAGRGAGGDRGADGRRLPRRGLRAEPRRRSRCSPSRRICAGIVGRRISAEEYFAEFLES